MQKSEDIVKRFIRRFDSSNNPFESPYYFLACHVALPLVITPDLVNYIRVCFLKQKGVPWIAEADLLLSNLCRPVGYEQYVMDKGVKAYLLDKLKQDSRLGGEVRLKEIASLLFNYIQHLDKTNPFISSKEIQTQKWGAMLYLETDKTVQDIAKAISECVDELELIRLLQITKDFQQEIVALGKFDDFLEYAQLSNDLLRKPETVKPEQIKNAYSVAGLELTLPESVIQPPSILGLESFETPVTIATIVFDDPPQNNKVYNDLRRLLVEKRWKKADLETAKVMLQVAGKINQGWLSQKDLEEFPREDLRIINQLWIDSSQGHFGFSIQKEIYQSLGGTQKNIDRFGTVIGWKRGDQWLGYRDLSYSLDAPRGHLPSGNLISNKNFTPPPGTFPSFAETNISESLTFSLRYLLTLFMRADLVTWKSFDFEIVNVDKHGTVVKQQTKTAQSFPEILPHNITLEMVAIPGGTFTMGSPKNESEYDDERPQHNVTLSPFFMGKYPITQTQWKAIASRTDLKVNIDLDKDPSHFKGDNRPVEQVNWYEAVEFCQRLSKLTGRDYQLPSEAQWEYACRAMTEPLDLENGETYPPFYFGETITGELANYNASKTYAEETEGESRGETTPVGQFPANAFGLYDMHGNVWEWCEDDYHNNYQGALTDGSAWVEFQASYLVKNRQNDSKSMLRGGSWFNYPVGCRSAFRFINDRRDYLNSLCGFRVVCVFGKTP